MTAEWVFTVQFQQNVVELLVGKNIFVKVYLKDKAK